NNAISNLIREGKNYQIYSILETAFKDGMVTFDRRLKELYLEGLISYEDAIANMKNPEELKESST
ncbi:MAG: type IV pili twitching motility protein PilT, partial [Candidatus Hydrogenedens sp.]|nr:type IV pili twitching motility protein PilT [Candidatus Hydrogenedens sp.]